MKRQLLILFTNLSANQVFPEPGNPHINIFIIIDYLKKIIHLELVLNLKKFLNIPLKQ